MEVEEDELLKHYQKTVMGQSSDTQHESLQVGHPPDCPVEAIPSQARKREPIIWPTPESRLVSFQLESCGGCHNYERLETSLLVFIPCPFGLNIVRTTMLKDQHMGFL